MSRSVTTSLLDLVLKGLALNQVGDVIVIRLGLTLLALLHALVALGELAEAGQGVGAKLVKDAGHELRQLLVLAVAVDGKGVGWDSGVDWYLSAIALQVAGATSPV